VYGKVQGSRLYQKKGLHKVQPRWTCSGKACCPRLYQAEKPGQIFRPVIRCGYTKKKKKTERTSISLFETPASWQRQKLHVVMRPPNTLRKPDPVLRLHMESPRVAFKMHSFTLDFT
jgi:hypothetical protein